MISFDTTVVMRFVVALPPEQFVSAKAYIKKLRASGQQAYISNLTLSEAYFAAQTHYGFTKSAALDGLAQISRMPGIITTPEAAEVLSLPNLASAKPGFVDRLIHGESTARGHTLVTFEKAAKNLSNTLIL